MDSLSLFEIGIGIVFLILLVLSVYRTYIVPKFMKKEIPVEKDDAVKINIEGMNCNHCVMNVKKAISTTAGVEEVEVSLADNAAFVRGSFNLAELSKAVEDVGYKVTYN